MNIIIYVFI